MTHKKRIFRGDCCLTEVRVRSYEQTCLDVEVTGVRASSIGMVGDDVFHSDGCARVVCIWKAISDKASSRRHDIHRDYFGHGAEELIQSDQSTLIELVIPMIGAGLHTAPNMRDSPPRDFLYNLRPPSPSATVLCTAGNARGAQILRRLDLLILPKRRIQINLRGRCL